MILLCCDKADACMVVNKTECIQVTTQAHDQCDEQRLDMTKFPQILYHKLYTQPGCADVEESKTCTLFGNSGPHTARHTPMNQLAVLRHHYIGMCLYIVDINSV